MSSYFDYNASTPVDERVLEKMIHVYRYEYGNADSRTHLYGENARRAVETAREETAELLGISKEEVFFTSGATESNNMVLLGLQPYGEESGKKHIITTAVEHKSVLEAAAELERRGFEATYLKPDEKGRISLSQVQEALREDTLLVSIAHANNETGVIQPVEEIGEELKKRGVLFHMDVTQTCGKLVEELRRCTYDFLSFSAHKLYGPQGIGALAMRKTDYQYPPLKPILFGGGQERGMRPGTVPAALAAGLGEACRICAEEWRHYRDEEIRIRTEILKALESSGLRYEINGDQENTMKNTLNISFSGVNSEALMIAARSCCGISNGSACTSKDYSESYVLKAMGIPPERIRSAVRLSWGRGTDSIEDFRELLNIVKQFQI